MPWSHLAKQMKNQRCNNVRVFSNEANKANKIMVLRFLRSHFRTKNIHFNLNININITNDTCTLHISLCLWQHSWISTDFFFRKYFHPFSFNRIIFQCCCHIFLAATWVFISSMHFAHWSESSVPVCSGTQTNATK